MDFVHLHTHSEFSLLDGASRLQEMVAAAKAAGQTAIALTDHGSLYGVIPFFKACRAAGVKPIIGCETYVAQRTLHDKESKVDRDPHHLVLLAADQTGYRNLMRMISTAHLEGYYVRPRVDKKLMAAHSEGVIALSACLAGEVSERVREGDLDGATRVAEEYREIFGDRYFLEVQNHAIPEEDVSRAGVIEIARRTGIPLVATNDSHYTAQADAQMHDVLLCIQTGKRVADQNRMRFSGDHFYIRPEDEMLALFPECEEAVRNTAHVAAMCDVDIELGGMLLPRYDVPGGMDADAYLRTLCEDGLRRRYGTPSREQQARLDHELEVITEMGYAPYFLIVWDFVHHAKTHGVLVGPGRGSAAGSMVSYCLDITTLDPLHYGLIFERFLNRERVSMPDIDIDFSVAGRESVIRYVTQKYGEERVAQIGTFGTMAGKAAIRDVGRVLDVSIPEVDPIAKMIPVHQGKTVPLAKSLEQVGELRQIYDSEPRYKELIDTAMRLEGITRSVGTHAAGVVITPEPLVNYVPLQRGTTDKSTIVTQYEMTAIQELGLLKMDFLGLRNLDIIDACVRIVRQTRGEEVRIEDVPLDDPATYELLCRADTLGIFQMESPGMRRILVGLRPSLFEDISVVNALYRPGPIEAGLIDQYVACKNGQQAVEYLHPTLEEVLGETYGVPVYQEQVMGIAMTMAGFTRGESDILRAAMGKKDKAKMAKQREKFIAGCIANGIPESEAAFVFEKVEFFAGYGFNKAHAMAYGMISYQTAYLKANYPIEYLCALLRNEDDQTRVAAIIVDCQDHGIEVAPPDVNTSEADFAVVRMPADGVPGRISYGLRGVKNVGVRAIELLVEERRANGPYASLLDLCLRLDLHEVNKRVLEALVKCGALDSLGERAQLLVSLDRFVDRAQEVQRERASGQVSLFGDDTGVSGGGDVEVRLVQGVPAADDRTRLAWEREFLGIYLSDHPLRRVEAELHARTDTRCSEIGTDLEGFQVRVGGVVREIRRRPDRSGRNMAFVELEDLTGSVSVTVFSRVLEQAAEVLQPDRIVLMSGKVDSRRRARDGGEGEEASIVADSVWAFEDPDPVGWQRSQVVHLAWPMARDEAELPALATLLREHPGADPVVLHLEDAEQSWELELEGVRVAPSSALQTAIEAMLGPGTYRCEVLRQKAPERRPYPRERERGGEAA